MRDRIIFWIRRPRFRLTLFVKGLCLISILFLILVFSLENRKWASVAKAEADTEIESFVRSRETPSGAFVLPDSETVVHNPQSHCNVDNGSNVLTLFMVVSAPGNRAARDIIRAGFKFYIREYNNEIGGHVEPNTKLNTLLFFTGLPETPIERRKLLNEADLHGDLIIDDLKDSYLNLTLKSMRLLKWVHQNCYNAEFTVKVDDDFHINLRKLLDLLEKMSSEGSGKNMVAGTLFTDALPVRDPSSIYGKWYTPTQLWPNDTFPNYIAGFFYVMGKDARSKIYRKALLKPLFHLEDVFITGIVASDSLGLELTNLPTISNYWTPLKNIVTSSCDIQNNYFGIHFHSKMFNYLECWKGFNDKDFACSTWPLISYCWFD